jgi:hypothetical protein
MLHFTFTSMHWPPSIPKKTIVSSRKKSFKSLSKRTLLYLSDLKMSVQWRWLIMLSRSSVSLLICYLPALSLADGDMLWHPASDFNLPLSFTAISFALHNFEILLLRACTFGINEVLKTIHAFVMSRFRGDNILGSDVQVFWNSYRSSSLFSSKMIFK